MAYAPLPPQELLNQLFRYEPDTGKLFWRERPVSMFTDKKQPATWNAAIWNGKNAGKEACSKMQTGYLETSIFRRKVTAHRVIWKMVAGIDPDDIDHINGERSDNRWVNLRSVSHEANGRNLAVRKNNSSGVNGVSWYAKLGKWGAKIHVSGKSIHLGVFTEIAEAEAAKKAADLKYGFHENHGHS